MFLVGAKAQRFRGQGAGAFIHNRKEWMTIDSITLPVAGWAQRAIAQRLCRRDGLGMSLYEIAVLQKQPKFWKGTSGCEDYCLYLGSFKAEEDNEPVDLYHYPWYGGTHRYSTAIVFGDDGGNYSTGWPELASQRSTYRELMRREVECGLIIEPQILVTAAMAMLGSEAHSYAPPITKWSSNGSAYLKSRRDDEAYMQKSYAYSTYEFRRNMAAMYPRSEG
jgi:hypothetical protein